MPPEILALIDKPWLLLAVLAAGAACGMAVERFVESSKRAERRAFWRKRQTSQKGWNDVFGKGRRSKRARDTVEWAADQLTTVMNAKFRARSLLNKSERRLLSVLEAALREESPGWRVMGQVSLGEVLSSEEEDAYFAINSKRVDFLIVNANCYPLHAVEFQGAGHHVGKTAAARDAVKKEALRRAGIGYVEVKPGDTPGEVRELIQRLVRKSKPIAKDAPATEEV